MPEKPCKWQASFRLSPPILLGEIRNTTDIRIVKDSNAPNARASRIEIVTPELSYEDARNYALEVTNRVTDYLSFLKRFPVGAILSNIGQILPADSRIHMRGYATLRARATVERPVNLDMAVKPIAQIIGGQEAKLARQLSRYRRALETDDVINRVREAYQIIEDEGTDREFLSKYRYVRHLVSHPELADHRAASQATERFGKPYIDPSSPEDLAKLDEDAKSILKKAEEILLSKLSTSERS